MERRAADSLAAWRGAVGGTVAATHVVLRDGYGLSGHVAGGTHHAFFDRGEGFCVFSDIAVAANVALRDYGPASGVARPVERVLIVDLDVHQVASCAQCVGSGAVAALNSRGFGRRGTATQCCSRTSGA